MNYFNNYQNQIKAANNNIKYYQLMITTCNDPCKKIAYGNLLKTEMNNLNQLYYLAKENISNEEYEIIKSSLREFTLEELSQYDGSDGKPAYVAVNGIVYDVSLESRWGGGTHFGLYAGRDLTAQFNSCHDGLLGTLNNLPQVGLLKNN